MDHLEIVDLALASFQNTRTHLTLLENHTINFELVHSLSKEIIAPMSLR